MVRFVVIGGGIGGMEIGALLSDLGEVIVFEKSSQIGGRAMVVEKEGFLLDFGAHPIRFGPNSAIAQTMRDIDRPIDFVKPGDVIGLLEDGSSDLFPSGGLMAIFKTKMIPKLKTLKLILRFVRYKEEEIEKLLDVPLQEFIEEQGFGPRIRRYLKMSCAALMVCPFLERVSTGEFIKNIKEVLDKGSVYYPRGGWNSFFNPLKEKIKGSGGKIKL